MELGSISTWEQWSMWNRFRAVSFHELIFREKSETKNITWSYSKLFIRV